MAATSIEEAIYNRATTFAGLSALISTRAYHYERPDGATHPHVVFWQVSAIRESASGSDLGICHGRWQFDVWAATAANARAVGKQVRLAFERWRGTDGSVTVQDSFVENEMDLAEEPIEEREYHRMLEFVIHHEEATS